MTNNAINFAINVVNHCNQRCEFCNHHAPYMEKKEHRPDEYIRHFAQLEKKCGHIGGIRLSGGEPFLHSNLLNFVNTIRPFTPVLVMTSNLTWMTNEEEVTRRAEVFRSLNLFIASLYQPNETKLQLIEVIRQYVKVTVRPVQYFIKANFLGEPQTVGQDCDQRTMTNLLFNGCLARCPVAAYAGHNPRVTKEFLMARKDAFFNLYEDSDYETWRDRWPLQCCYYCTMWQGKAVRWETSPAEIH